jgi:hypothetical protein
LEIQGLRGIAVVRFSAILEATLPLMTASRISPLIIQKFPAECWDLHAAAAAAAAGSITGGVTPSIDWSGPDQPPAANGGSARVGAELQALDGEGNVVAQASSRSQPPDPDDPNNRTCAEHWLCRSIDWQKLKDSGVLKVLLKIVSNKGIGPCPQCWARLTQIAQQYVLTVMYSCRYWRIPRVRKETLPGTEKGTMHMLWRQGRSGATLTPEHMHGV